MKISLILPIKEELDSQLLEFLEHYSAFDSKNIDIVISDNSSKEVSDYIDSFINENQSKLVHITNKWAGINKNLKLLNLKKGIEFCYGSVVVFADSDTRLTQRDLEYIYIQTVENKTSRGGFHYKNPSIRDFIDISGTWIVNLLTKEKQFWGYQAFSRSEIISAFEKSSCDILFDELHLFRLIHEENDLNKFVYLNDLSVEMSGHTSVVKYFEQRTRYSYENIAFSKRFCFYLLIPFLIAFLSILSNVVTAMCAFISSAILLSSIGSFYYNIRNKWPFFSFLFAPIYVIQHVLFSWVALFLFISRRGVKFSGSKIVKPS